MLSEYAVVDLTHTLDEEVPTWSEGCGFDRKVMLDYEDVARVYEYRCLGGAGTHIDAPSHFLPEGRHIDEIPVQELLAPLCIVDLQGEVQHDSQIGLREFEVFEKEHGKIPEGSVVVGHTGWWRRWGNPKTYRNLNDKGEISIPSFSAEVGPLLMERNIRGLGIDTLSPDSYSSNYPLHHLLLGAGKYIIENLTHLDQVPKKGAHILALPPKIRAGTEAPIRAVALLPKGSRVS